MYALLNSKLHPTVRDILLEQTVALSVLKESIGTLKQTLQNTQLLLSTLENQCLALKKAAEWTGFHAQMTVHEAWAAHPGAPLVFSGFHLPGCDQCPVGQDERLEEAAFGYAIDLQVLLAELNALS
jgi:hypothetical protein